MSKFIAYTGMSHFDMTLARFIKVVEFFGCDLFIERHLMLLSMPDICEIWDIPETGLDRDRDGTGGWSVEDDMED